MSELYVSCLVGFVGIALCLYLVMGGADYGAGILELWPSRRWRQQQKEVINQALGPVWEANHMWLIIVIVILLIGFPEVFRLTMTALHVPVVALLWGVVLRGAVFTFRHYDAVQARTSQRVYTTLFGLSSLWTSFWIGVLAASLFRGHIDPDATDPWLAYVAPWWGFLPVCGGAFVCVLFAFLGSAYLVGETRQAPLQRYFLRRTAVLHALVYAMGAVVFWAGHEDHSAFLAAFWHSKWALMCIGVAGCCGIALWFAAARQAYLTMGLMAAAHNTAIVLGWYLLHIPSAMVVRQGPLTFYAAAAPQATVRQLLLALAVGSVAIFPSLFLLLAVFKRPETDEVGL
jgi:cytochrome d ubiquinol oxidase subunit II